MFCRPRRRRHWIFATLIALFVIGGIIGTIHPNKKPKPGTIQALQAVKSTSPGYRTLNANGTALACAEVLAVDTYNTGLPALTLKANNTVRNQVYVWQFHAGTAIFTTGTDWPLVIYWMAGNEVVGSSISRINTQLSSPGPVTAAVAIPVAVVPYRQPSTLTLGSTCVPTDG